MKPSRFRTLLIGLTAGVAYAFLTMWLVSFSHFNVSVTYIFILPVVLGAIPVMLSTKEQLQSYKIYLLLPWGIVMTFFFLCFAFNFDGMLCLIVIVGPFLLVGSLAGFLARLGRLKDEGKGTKLYASLLLPFLVLLIETNFQAADKFNTVTTTIEVNADKAVVWENVKNVKDIKPGEITTHVVHLMGVPKPLNGELDREGPGGIRSITWEKGIKFQEIITSWDEGNGFAYDINVDPASIPPTSLDEHVMIGGRYFDVVAGSYKIDQISEGKTLITLTCKYRVTTTLNWYSSLWADYLLNDFNEMILEVIKKRSEE
ncbi:hypothetical protein GFS24_03990 [Chitinophaga sp. SYP-B3965]|uniref:hypothetical protein n=1 Tax=Chitinophaga sp. SYP-B3965 TaxID=2663120 RepID=UPI001299855A|nr:hypothetical protein [Chitinophaga sp. SYP-B3965]MRG44258.1 hypothetical protein [Chitinophaga sp. SYP-B3965]